MVPQCGIELKTIDYFDGGGIAPAPADSPELDLRLALYQPDIPQNTGTILRTAACLGVAVEIVEPAGFNLSDKGLRRAGLDYLPAALWRRHASFDAFEAWRRTAAARLVLLTTAAPLGYVDFAFRADDILMLGSESAGVPAAVHAAADARIAVPMRPGMRSLNVAVAAAIVLGEALRQTGGLPALTPLPDGQAGP